MKRINLWILIASVLLTVLVVLLDWRASAIPALLKVVLLAAAVAALLAYCFTDKPGVPKQSAKRAAQDIDDLPRRHRDPRVPKWIKRHSRARRK